MSVRISKFLSLVLRHEPERIGIALDEAGWTDVDALLAALAAHGSPLTRAELRSTCSSHPVLRRRACITAPWPSSSPAFARSAW